MSQWGSKYLADQGYTAEEIIWYYYGDNMYVNTAEQIAGIPASWPGYDLEEGSYGEKVLQLQEQLNAISKQLSPDSKSPGGWDLWCRNSRSRPGIFSGCSACR